MVALGIKSEAGVHFARDFPFWVFFARVGIIGWQWARCGSSEPCVGGTVEGMYQVPGKGGREGSCDQGISRGSCFVDHPTR